MTQNTNTSAAIPEGVYLNLDEIVAPVVTLRYRGEDHVLDPLDVDGFIVNTRALQTQSITGGVEQELGLTMDMIVRSFPTMTRDMLGKMKLIQLNAILKFATESASGKTIETGNPQKAGV